MCVCVCVFVCVWCVLAIGMQTVFVKAKESFENTLQPFFVALFLKRSSDKNRVFENA